MVHLEPLDGELALASHWVVMNSLKQFLSLAVQNAEEISLRATFSQMPDEVKVALGVIMAASVVFILVAMGVMCWLRWKLQKKHNPNLTAGQFWRVLFMTDGPGS